MNNDSPISHEGKWSRAKDDTPPTLMRRVGRLSVIVACILIGAMWVYAFVFASRESINKIDDADWTAQAQVRCEQAYEERSALANLERVDRDDPASLEIRAGLIEQATDSLSRMIDDIEAITPTSEKGKALVPKWIADYRTYVQDRRDYIQELREGRLPTFSESQVDSVPISERIGKFARENKMRACQPPIDMIL